MDYLTARPAGGGGVWKPFGARRPAQRPAEALGEEPAELQDAGLQLEFAERLRFAAGLRPPPGTASRETGSKVTSVRDSAHPQSLRSASLSAA